ncbi:MAG: SRPBCC family protein [Gaiellaceae bacterium]
MESTTETVTIERELVIDASPEVVLEFLVDPEKAVLWMGMSATFDARPGGEYRIEVIPGHTAAGEFVEVDPPHRLVYTWGWEPGEDGPASVPPGASTVEIELTRSGGGTALRFTHSGLPTEAAESHGYGWDHYLARLAIAGAGDDPGVDPWVTGEM